MNDKNMKRITILSAAILQVMGPLSVSANQSSPVVTKAIPRIEQFSQTLPEDFELIDWQAQALKFDELVFDDSAEGNFMPLIWEDDTYETFGLPAYVGDERLHEDGAQEAVTNIAAVLSATLNGVDKSEWVPQLSAFFDQEEKIILNNPAGSSETTSMWYLLYPTILFAHVSELYPEQKQIREELLTAIESWYKAYEVMYNDGTADFDYTGFNFLTNEPYRNGTWTEPDSAVGIGLLMYYGYQLTGEDKYIEAAIQCMDYLETYFGSPLYEALMYYGPYLASQLNTYHQTDYDLLALFNDNFNAVSIPRGGWGSVVGKWGNYEVNGLFGSDTDGGGYVFSMNTFAAASAIAPAVRYDARYAKSIAIWLLHLTSNSRYFFSTYVNDENQSSYYLTDENMVEEKVLQGIPYEGIRQSSQGRTPWVGGDPTVYDWALTDHSLYSGAHIGLLASLVNPTNVDGILRIDLQATQFYDTSTYAANLFYNPFDEEQDVEYEVMADEPIDLWDITTNEVIAENISTTNTNFFTIEPDRAMILVELPAGAELEEIEGHYYVEGEYVSSQQFSLNNVDIDNNQKLSGEITIQPEVGANYDMELAKVEVEIDDEILSFNQEDTVTFNTQDFESGTKKLIIRVITEDGKTDELTRRVRFE